MQATEGSNISPAVRETCKQSEVITSISTTSITLPSSNLDRERNPFYGTLKTCELFTFVPATEGSNISPPVCETRN